MNTSFSFQKYFRRAIKYLIYLIIIFLLVIAIFSFISKQPFSFSALFRPGTGIQIALFLLGISAIYPLIGYTSKKVFLNTSYNDELSTIEDILNRNNFKKECSLDNCTLFRHKNPFLRAMRMFEDHIVINHTDNPIILEGQRKDVYRIARMIEYAIREKESQ
jgi:hypothetical protein